MFYYPREVYPTEPFIKSITVHETELKQPIGFINFDKLRENKENAK